MGRQERRGEETLVQLLRMESDNRAPVPSEIICKGKSSTPAHGCGGSGLWPCGPVLLWICVRIGHSGMAHFMAGRQKGGAMHLMTSH